MPSYTEAPSESEEEEYVPDGEEEEAEEEGEEEEAEEEGEEEGEEGGGEVDPELWGDLPPGGCVVMPDYLHHLLSRSTSGSLNLWGQSKCLSIIFSTHDNIFLLYTWQSFDSFAVTGSFTERAVNRTALSLSC